MKLIVAVLFTLQLVAKTHAHAGCGAHAPSMRERMLDQHRMQHSQRSRRQLIDADFTCQDLCKQCIEVDVYFHMMALPLLDYVVVLPHPTSAVEEYINGRNDEGLLESFTTIDEMNALINQQMDVLNEGFKDTPFKFIRQDPISNAIVPNLDWANFMYDYQIEISSNLAYGDGLETLNVYLSYAVQSQSDQWPPGVIGLANFPSYQFNKTGDGVFMRYDALTGGGLYNQDSGITLVHEVGHWLGLYHTFQKSFPDSPDEEAEDPCQSDNLNDFVDDTPTMAGPSQDMFVCRDFGLSIPDTCPNLPGLDPVYSYMNYLDDDACYIFRGLFTCGQIERMYRQWLLYRKEVRVCADDEMEVDIVIFFDAQNYADENRFYLTNESGDMIIDSRRDHSDDFVIFGIYGQESMAIDLCLPKSENHEFWFEDKGGNGFATGSVELSLNRKLACKVEGNFGSEARMTFNGDGALCPGETAPPATGPLSDLANQSSPSTPTAEQPVGGLGSFPPSEAMTLSMLSTCMLSLGAVLSLWL